MIISAFILLSSFVDLGFSYNILGVFPMQVKSHYAIIDPLMVRLAELGHNVTIYDPFPKKRPLPNYNEFDTSKCFGISPEFGGIRAMLSMGDNRYNNLMLLFMIGINTFTLESFENCSPLKKLMNSTTKYDLLITESFMSDATQLFANKFQTPIVAFLPNTLLPWLSDRMANPANPSYIPHMVSGHSPKMTFIDRVHNTLFYFIGAVAYDRLILKRDDEINKHFLGSSAPSLYDTVKNTSIIFVNAHNSLTPVMPLVPGVVPIAGIHIKPASPLAKVRSFLM